MGGEALVFFIISSCFREGLKNDLLQSSLNRGGFVAATVKAWLFQDLVQTISGTLVSLAFPAPSMFFYYIFRNKPSASPFEDRL
jgi:hypothetical protein